MFSIRYVRDRQQAGEVVTGLLYIDPESRDHHEVMNTVESPLWGLPFEDLCPGSDAMDALMNNYR